MTDQIVSQVDTAGIGAELAKAFGDAVTSLKNAKQQAEEGKRLFFPDGIQYIHLAISIGPKDKPLVSGELTISGEKGKPGINLSNPTEDAIQT
jgi:hypothetical protein